MSEVISFGGINIDLVVYINRPPNIGETMEGGSVQFFLGGKGANQAVAASRLGVPISFVGNVGRDFFGREVQTLLSKENIELSMLGSVKEKTGMAIISVSNDAENQIIFIPGANKVTKFNQIPKERLKNAQIIISQMEVETEEVEKLFVSSKKYETLNILNVAPYKKPTKELLFNSDILVFNELEFCLFTKLKSHLSLQLDSLKQKLDGHNFNKNQSIIITLGERGLVFYQNNQMEHIEGLKVNALDTVGSGDCFVGALSFSLLEGKSLKESCEFANKSAAISVTRQGAATSMPTIDEVVNYN